MKSVGKNRCVEMCWRRIVAIALVAASPLAAYAQIFNAPAFAIVMVVGQKRSCAVKFPDLASELQRAFDVFVSKNQDVVSAQKLSSLDKSSGLENSPAFSLSREQCVAVTQTIASMSLQEMLEAQEKANKEREKAERQ